MEGEDGDLPHGDNQNGFNRWPNALKNCNWVSTYHELSVAQAAELFNPMRIDDNMRGSIPGTVYKMLVNNPVIVATRSRDNLEFMSTSAYKLLRKHQIILARPGVREEIDLVQNLGPDPPPRVVPEWDTLLLNYDHMFTTPPHGLIQLRVANQFRLTQCLSLMCAFPEAEVYYHQYCFNPDNGVTTSDDPAVLNGVENPPDPLAQDLTTPRNLRWAYVFFAGMLMVKNLVNVRQYNDFFTRRTSALRHVLSDPSLDVNNIKGVFPMETCKAIYEHMAFYPRLKTQISMMLVSANSMLREHCFLILSQSQMSLFAQIQNFVYGDIKTRAHLEPKVIQEMRLWIAVYKDLVERYGVNWVLYKLFEPNGTMLQNGKWPTLAMAALAYGIVYKSKTLKKLQ